MVSVDTGVIDRLISLLLPAVNSRLPEVIRNLGLDPLATVVSGSGVIGKTNLGICTAKAKGSYNIKNMEGLSSLAIRSINSETFETTGSGVNGEVSFYATLGSTLSAQVSGKVKASCSVVSDKVGISGNVSAKGVIGTGAMTYVATLGNTNCLTSVSIKSLSLSYSDIDVNLGGLGVFNDFLAPLVDLVDDLFGNQIRNALTPVIEDAIDDAIQDYVVPLCL